MNLNNKNKKGQIGIIYFFILLFATLAVAFVASIAVSAIDLTSDTITPIMSELGMIGSANMTQISGYTFEKVDNIIQSFSWLIGFLYLIMIIMSVLFVTIVPTNTHPTLIGFYIILIIALVFFAILMSNMYQDIYVGDNDISLRLQEQTLLSFMILHSPKIMVLIAFVTGIILFSRQADGGGGGFGI